MDILKLRGIADSLLDGGKYKDAYHLYNEIYNQVWNAIGTVQKGLGDFSQSFLNTNFQTNLEFKRSYTTKAAKSLFIKWFNLDSSQTLNEMTFTTYGHLQCVCYSPELSSSIPAEIIYNEFLILHTLILSTGDENWVNEITKVVTPQLDTGYFKKLFRNYSDSSLKKTLIKNVEELKSTDWNNVNHTLIDYMLNIGHKNSELFASIYNITGYNFNNKRQKRHSNEEKSNRQRQYKNYERFEKHAFNNEPEFDLVRATEFEKAKYFGNLLGLSGRIKKAEIRKNYLKLIAQYHPDKVFGLGEELVVLAEKKTKQLNIAYEWMKNKYDL